MRFENHFDVDAPLEEVWEALLDVERVAPTVPGAQVLERTGDDAYKVAIKVKVGPMSMTYNGEVEITDRDAEAHRAVMRARAEGVARPGHRRRRRDDGARAATTAAPRRRSSPRCSSAARSATMGQGVLQDVSGRLIGTFADNLAAMLAGGRRAGRAGAGDRDGGRRGGADGRAGVGRRPDPARGRGARPIRPPPEPAEALDLGSLGGAMVADRLRDPRVLGGLLGVRGVRRLPPRPPLAPLT